MVAQEIFIEWALYGKEILRELASHAREILVFLKKFNKYRMTANPLMHLISHQDDQDQSLWPGQLMLEICLVLLYVSDFDPTRSGLGLGLFYLGES